MDTEKRPLDAIEIVRRAHEKISKIRFQWVGTGTMVEKARACALRYPYINFAGFVDEAEKWRTLAEAEVFISTSEREGFGTTIAQALLMETPVITYDLPVHRSVFGETIIYVPCFGIQSFSETLVSVLSHPERYRDMVQKGKNLVKKEYSVEAFAMRVEGALYELELYS